MCSDRACRRPAATAIRRAWRSAPVLALLLTATAALAVVGVESEFLGSADIASAASYCWKGGTPAPNAEMERIIRAAVDKQLVSRGYRPTECEAELMVAAHTLKDDSFPAGLIRIEVSMASTGAPTGKVVWRGTAQGMVAEDKLKARRRIAGSAIKKMFKPFPKSRTTH